MPFGLCNAPESFQRMMNLIFQEYIEKFLMVYIDDTIIYSNTFEEHIQHLRLVLELIRENGLFLKPTKCTITEEKVEFLGYLIDRHGVHTDPKKVAAIAEYPAPTNITDLRAFLG